jgi:cytochrome c2
MLGVVAVVVLAIGGGLGANQIEARQRLEARVHALTGGDAQAGRIAIAHRPCGGCHEIPGVDGAQGRVGPPLTHFAGRAYIGGRADNTPDNLVRWIEDPHTVDPDSAMPPMGIGPTEARNIAAYLYTLG